MGQRAAPSYAPRGVRYDYKTIVGRIETELKRREIEDKQLYQDLGWTPGQWSRKRRKSGNAFSLKDLSRIADWFNAPPGWPFVDWAAADANQRALDLLATLSGSARNHARETQPETAVSEGKNHKKH